MSLIGSRQYSVWNSLFLEKYLKKLAGRTDIEDALKRLDQLTQEEVRMAIAQVLKLTHGIDSKVKIVIEGAQACSAHHPYFLEPK